MFMWIIFKKESPYLDPYVIPGTFDGDYENGASEC